MAPARRATSGVSEDAAKGIQCRAQDGQAEIERVDYLSSIVFAFEDGHALALVQVGHPLAATNWK